MQTKQEALSRASHDLSSLIDDDVLANLRAADVYVKRLILGGSHSVVTYPPLDSLTPVTERDLSGVRFGATANLYVHIAFCETQCTFCHYAVSLYRGAGHSNDTKRQQVDRYLAALKMELHQWSEKLRASGTTIASIYIGGGTPLVLEQDQLDGLIQTIHREFAVLPGVEFCVEGSPLTIVASDGENKLHFLVENGITRLSFGVQSFDDTVLKFAARGYRREVAIRACEIVSRIFDNWNVDLIQGLHSGNVDEVWNNLEAIAQVRPAHLTWYHGRFAKRPQGDWWLDEHKRANFEDEKSTLLGRLLIWQQMAELGYQQIDGNRFVREEKFVDPFKKIRISVQSDLLGVGASSYSHTGGIFFRNVFDHGAYVAEVEAGRSPIATGRALTSEELLAASYVVGLRTIRRESETTRHICVELPELATHYQALEERLLGLAVLQKDDDGLKLTQLGRLFEDEVLSLFYSPSVQRALEQTNSTLTNIKY